MTLPAGRLVKVEFEVRLPTAATKEEVDQWAAYALGSGSMPATNPLCDHDLEFWELPPTLTDTGLIGRTEEYGHRPTESGTVWHCRHIREIG
jgi:hypothetical protein